MDVSIPCKNFVFTDTDIKNLSQPLKEAFPGAKYFPELTYEECGQTERPKLHVSDNLADLSHLMAEGHYLQISLNPEAKPVIEKRYNIDSWGIYEEDFPVATFQLSTRAEKAMRGKILTHWEGRVFVNYEKGNKAERAMTNKFFRILRKNTTNKLVQYYFPEPEPRWIVEKGADVWIGADVVRWCDEHPYALLSCSEDVNDENCAHGFRPMFGDERDGQPIYWDRMDKEKG